MCCPEEDASSRSVHRRFQRLVDGVFWQSLGEAVPSGALMLQREVRLEAAFRAWLRDISLRASPPAALPDETALSVMANELDHAYGDDLWWQWAIWSSCALCCEKEMAECGECRDLAAFFWLTSDDAEESAVTQ